MSYKPPYTITAKIVNLIAKISEEMAKLEFIHPFNDGNGRIGRLWQSVILYSWKKAFVAIPLESVVRDYQERYYEAIEVSNALGESTPFVEFMLESILNSIKSSEISSDKSSVNTDKAILSYLQKNPKATIKMLALELQLTTRAIEKQLANLKKENRLQRIGTARKGEWVVTEMGDI